MTVVHETMIISLAMITTAIPHTLSLEPLFVRQRSLPSSTSSSKLISTQLLSRAWRKPSPCQLRTGSTPWSKSTPSQPLISPRSWTTVSPPSQFPYYRGILKIITKQRFEIHLDTYLKLLPEEIQRVLKAIPPPSPQFCWSECTGQRKAQAVRVSTSFQHPNIMFPSLFVYRLGLITSVKRTNWKEVQTMLDLSVFFNQCVNNLHCYIPLDLNHSFIHRLSSISVAK